MKVKKEILKEFSIRVSEELDTLIQEDASRNKRSKNLQVNFVLEDYYASKLSGNSLKEKPQIEK